MKISILKSVRGVTFIELLVSMSIAMLVMGAVTVTYISSTKHYTRNREMAQVQMRSRLSVDFISQELRNAGYLVNWDTTDKDADGNPDVPVMDINQGGVNSLQAIVGAFPDSNTDTITVRYALGPVAVAAGGTTNTVTTLNQPAVDDDVNNQITVNAVDFNGDGTNEITNGTLIAIYAPPTNVNVRRVSAISGNILTLDRPIALPTGTPQFPANTTMVALVQETSFWIQGGNLMMNTVWEQNPTGSNWRRSTAGNAILASRVEDLQMALLTKNQGIVGDGDGTNNGIDDSGVALLDNPGSLPETQLREVRSVRLSLTAQGTRGLQDKASAVPPSLEDRDRSGEAADQILREVQQTTVYLRNLGALDP